MLKTIQFYRSLRPNWKGQYNLFRGTHHNMFYTEVNMFQRALFKDFFSPHLRSLSLKDEFITICSGEYCCDICASHLSEEGDINGGLSNKWCSLDVGRTNQPPIFHRASLWTSKSVLQVPLLSRHWKEAKTTAQPYSGPTCTREDKTKKKKSLVLSSLIFGFSDMFFTNIFRLREAKRKPGGFTFLRNNQIFFEMLASLMYNAKTRMVLLVTKMWF